VQAGEDTGWIAPQRLYISLGQPPSRFAGLPPKGGLILRYIDTYAIKPCFNPPLGGMGGKSLWLSVTSLWFSV